MGGWRLAAEGRGEGFDVEPAWTLVLPLREEYIDELLVSLSEDEEGEREKIGRSCREDEVKTGDSLLEPNFTRVTRLAEV